MTTTTTSSLKWNKTGNDGEYRSSCGRFEIRATRAAETHWGRDVWNLFDASGNDLEWVMDYDRLKDAKQDAVRFADDDVQVIETDGSLDLINHALDIATIAHDGQTRWDGSDYIDHPVRVALAVGPYGKEATAVALLHDVLEDTSISSADLTEFGFGEEIVEAVEALTRRDAETYAEFIERVDLLGLARVVKLADLADNLRDLPADHSLRNRYESAVARLEN